MGYLSEQFRHLNKWWRWPWVPVHWMHIWQNVLVHWLTPDCSTGCSLSSRVTTTVMSFFFFGSQERQKLHYDHYTRQRAFKVKNLVVVINFGNVPYWIKGTITERHGPEFYYKMADKFTVMWIITSLTLQGILQMRTTLSSQRLQLMTTSTFHHLLPHLRLNLPLKLNPLLKLNAQTESGSTNDPRHSKCNHQLAHWFSAFIGGA